MCKSRKDLLCYEKSVNSRFIDISELEIYTQSLLEKEYFQK